jgi:N-acetylglucosaminyldiphosphoundecaprenol N-acetyl-beta-D-mannosaminyltransferase
MNIGTPTILEKLRTSASLAGTEHLDSLLSRPHAKEEPTHSASPALGLNSVPASPTRSIPPIAILGVPFDNVTTLEAIELIQSMVASRKPHYLITANVDFLVQAREDVELRRIFFDAHLVLCDGTPLVWASRLLGNPLPERVAGADLVPLLMSLAAREKYRVFFLGATPDAAKQAVARLEATYPGIIIAGHHSPPFAKLMEMDHDDIKQRILGAKPDLLFVCFGCPKQEKWIAMHYRDLGVPVAVGVGGTLDFLSGQLKRAPRWMQSSGTEWLFRLAQEPRRLFGRYARDLEVFGRSIIAQWWHLQFSLSRADRKQHSEVVRSEVHWQWIRLPERFDLAMTVADPGLADPVLADGRHCLLEITSTKFIDSTGIGRLIGLQKRIRATGRQLVLLSPSPAVQRAMRLMHLENFFATAPDVSTALYLIETRNREERTSVTLRTAAAASPLVWLGEITAVNAGLVWEHTRAHLLTVATTRATEPRLPEGSSGSAGARNGKNLPSPELIIDLSAVRFIDSTGLGLMVRTKKFARQQNTRLLFTGLQAPVRNVLRLARLEEFLLGE